MSKQSLLQSYCLLFSSIKLLFQKQMLDILFILSERTAVVFDSEGFTKEYLVAIFTLFFC